MNDGKQYLFQFNVDNSALNSAATKIETRLSEAMRNGMSLDRSGKAEVKQSLAQIFGIAEEQAETLRKAMQGIVSMKPEGVKDLKNQLKETLDFVSGIMTQMKKVNASTDWMKQGVGFVDSFKTLQTALDHTQKTVSGLEVSVGELKSSFQGFADAFKANDPSAYFKKFGDGVDSVVSRIEGRLKQAKTSINALIQSGDVVPGDFSDSSTEDLNKEYERTIQTLSDLEAQMSKAKAGTKEYKNYLIEAADALLDLQEITKLLPKNASQGMGTATADVVATIRKAGEDLKHTITNLKLDNIKLSVELPDAQSAEFGAKINTFVAAATKQFQTKPISVSLDITNPFKHLDGEELSKTQKKIADRATTEANKSLKKITGATDTSEAVALTGNASADRILASFQNSFAKIESGLRSGQTSIKEATKQWRTEMDELLKLRFTWEKTANTNEVQQMFDQIQEIAYDNPIHLRADIETFIDDIQAALKDARISINANIENANIKSFGVGNNGGQIFDSIQKSVNNQGSNTKSSAPIFKTDSVTQQSNHGVPEVLKSIIQTSKYLDALNRISDQNGVEPTNKAIEEFIGVFEHVPVMAKSVMAAKNYLEKSLEFSNYKGADASEISKLTSEKLTAFNSFTESIKGVNEKSFGVTEGELDFLKRNQDRINSIVNDKQNPALLIADSLDTFYAKTDKIIDDATKKAQVISERITSKNNELSAAEAELKNLGENTDAEAAKTLRAKIAQLKSDITGLNGELRDTNRKSDTANARRSLLEQKGFKDVRNLDENERISFITNLLKQSETLASQLSQSSMRINGSDVKLSLASLQDLIYFIPEIQKTLGVTAKTTDQWSNEKGLQEKFINIFKLSNQLDALGSISGKNGIEPTNEAIQEFIRVFEHVPVMAKVIEEAKNYLEKSLALSGYKGKSKTKIATLTSEKDAAFTSLKGTINGKWYDTTVDGQQTRKYMPGAKDDIRSMLNSQEPIHVKVVGDGREKTYGLKQTGRSGNQDVTDKNYAFASAMKGAAGKFGIKDLLLERFDVGQIVDTMDAMSAERTTINRNLARLSAQEKTATDAEKSMLQKEQEELNARLEYINSFLSSGDNIAKYKEATRRIQEIDAEIANKVEISTKKNAPKRMSRRDYENYTSQRDALVQEKEEKKALLKSLEDEDSVRASWTARYQKQLDSKEIDQAQYDKLVQGISEAIRKSREVTQARIDEIDNLLKLGSAQDDAIQKLQVLNNNIDINKAKIAEASKYVKDYDTVLRNGFTENSSGRAWAYEKIKSGHKAGAIGQFGKVFSGDYTKSVDMNEERWADFKYRLQSAKETGTMDSGVISSLEEMINAREAAMKELDGMTQSQRNTTDGKARVEQLQQTLVENSRKKILEKYYETEGWFLNDLLSQRLKNIDLEFERAKSGVQSGSVSAESKYANQIEAENKRYAQEVARLKNQYTSSSSAYTLDTKALIEADLQRTEDEFHKAYQPIFNQLLKQRDHEAGNMRPGSKEYTELTQKYFRLADEQKAQLKSQFVNPIEQWQQELAKLPSTDGLQGQEKAAVEQKRAEIETQLNNYIAGLVEKRKQELISSFNQTRGEGENVTSLEEIQKVLSEGLDVALKNAAQVNADNLKNILPAGVKTNEQIQAEVDKLALTRDAQKVDAISGLMSGDGYVSDLELMRQQTEQARQSAQSTLDAEKALLKIKEEDKKALMDEHGITKEMLGHSQNIAQNHQQQAQAEQQAANAMQEQSSAGVQMQPNGGVGGFFNTSGLAQESTLRGIYTLLNGAPPAGGWGNEKFASGIKEELDLSVRSFSGKLNDFASGVSKVTNDIGRLMYENMAIVGKDGIVGGGYIGGAENEISSYKIKNFLYRNFEQDMQLALHNHPDGIAALTPQDIQSAINLKKSFGIGASGSIAGSKITGIDISGLDDEASSSLLHRYIDNIRQSIFADIFDDDFNIKDEFANSPSLDKQKLSDKLNGLLQDAIRSMGRSVDEIYGQIDVSQLDEASKRVANEVVESGAKAAIESSKQITKDDIKAQQAAFQSQFKTKELASGKKGFDIKGANKIDQALYHAKDRLNKAPSELTDNDLTRLTTAYDQLTKGLQEEIAKHLDTDTLTFLNNLKSQISSVLGANAPRIEEKSQASDAIKEAKSYLSQLKTEDGKKVSGASRAKTGIDKVYDVLNNGKDKLSDSDLTSLGQGYYRLQETVNHEVFKKLDENTKKVINEAITKAKEVLDQYGVTVSGNELVGTVLDDANKSLYTNANTSDKKQKAGRTISSVAEPQIAKDDKVISKASVYLDGTSTKQAVEKAEAEERVVSAKQKQKDLSAETTKNDAEATKHAEKKAEAINRTTNNAVNNTPSTTSAEPVDASTGTVESSGGILGILNQLAKDATVQQILTALNNGGKSAGFGGKQPDEGDKESLDLSADEALKRITEQVNADYPGAIKTGNLRANSNSYSVDFWRQSAQAQKEVEGIQKKINQLEADGKANTEDYNALIQQRNSLLQKQEKITLNINKDTGKITSKVGIENFAVGANAAEKELSRMQGVLSQLQDAGALRYNTDGTLTSQNQSINSWIQSMQALQVTRDKFASEGTLFDGKNNQVLSQMTTQTSQLTKEVLGLLNAESKFGGNVVNTFANPQTLVGTGELYNRLLSIATATGNVDMATVKFNNDSNTLTYTMQTGKNEVQDMSLHMNALNGAVTQNVVQTRHVDTAWQAFGKTLKGKWQEVARYLTTFGSIYRIWGVIKQGVNYVKEIDTALTELKKVTDATDASYNKFLKDMAQTGSVIGATVKDLTSSAADWARLGYSLEQAGELAKNTSILMNVSEFEDVNKATDTLISSLQAFKKAGQDVGTFSMEIIDKYNEVGNNYAISTSDLAESLTRSSAALVAANNSLEQSIAMTAAANTTIQNPESVGNALKVVSMRIRGVKSELEEAGEDTDGVVTNTAKLQEKIKALTNIDGSGGIDILTNTGEFKSTYDILLSISKVWKEMDDTSQAALLELVAGKTRGSVVAALFQNGDVLEEAYESATEASGSAMKELETYLDSIQGKMALFSNTTQTMWMNLLDSDFVKGLVDIGTWLVNIADKIGVIRLLFIGLSTIFMRKSGITSIGQFFKSGSIGAEEASKKLAELKTRYQELDGLNSQKNLRKQDRIAKQMKPYQDIVDGAEKAKVAQENLLQSQERLKTAETNLANARQNGYSPQIIAQYQSDVDAAKQEVTNATVEVQKLEAANKKLGKSAAIGFGKLKAGAVSAVKSLASIGKHLLEMYAITAIIDNVRFLGETIAKAFNKGKETVEDAQAKLDELKNELDAIESEIDSMNSELETTNEAIEDLMDKLTLSFTEQEELERLQAISAELEKQIAFQETLRGVTATATNEQAISATRKYLDETSFWSDKPRTERQEEGKETGQNVGGLVGTAVGIGLSFIPQLTSFAPMIIGALSTLGNWVGGMIGAESGGSDYDSEESVSEAIANMKETRQKFQEDIQEAMDSGDAEAFNEATAALDNYDAKMAEHMNVIYQNYKAFDWGTATEKQKEDMRELINLFDAYNIAMGSKDAVKNALDRLFGDEADEIVQAYANITKNAIAAGEAFEFTEADAETIKLDDDLDALGLTTQDVTDYFTKLGEAVAEATKFDFSDVISELAKLEGVLNSIKSIMEEFNENGIVSASTLDGLDEEIKNLDAFETYAEVLMSGTASLADVKTATEDLAKEFLDDNVDNLTSENKLSYVAQLEVIGVDNAKELVDSYLTNAFWNSTEFTNFTGNAEKLIALAKEYGVTIEDTAKAEELLAKRADKKTKQDIVDNAAFANAEAEYRNQQKQETADMLRTSSRFKPFQYLFRQIEQIENREGFYKNYSDKAAESAIANNKKKLEDNLEQYGYTLEDAFPTLEVIPDISTDQEKVDKAEKEYQEILDEMNLIVTPEINFNTNTALEETADVEDAFAALKDVYDEFDEYNIVSAKSLAGLQETFGNVDGFEEFKNILGDSTSTIEDVEKAIQGLANGFLNDFDFSKLLDANGNVIESEARRVASQLENIGVEGANEFIRQKATAYNTVKDMYGIDLANYENAEQAKMDWLIQKTKEQVNITGEELVNKVAELYNQDLNNFEGTWQEKVEAAKKAAIEIARANAAAQLSALNAEHVPYIGGDQYDPEALKAEKEYLRKKMQIKADLMKTEDEINAIYADDIVTDEHINTYYNPTTIDIDELGGNGSGSNKTELDWLDNYFTSIENAIKDGEARLENVISADTSGLGEKNTIIDGIIGLYEDKATLLETAMNAYSDRATKLFNGFDSDIQNRILNGSIDIKEYKGETAENIQKYFDYMTKASDLNIELDGVKITIADFSLQKFNDTANAFDNEIEESLQSDEDLLQAKIDLLEEQGQIVDPQVYKDLIAMENKELDSLKAKKTALEKILNAEVAAGRVKVGSEQWYEMKGAIDDVSAAIIDSTSNVEQFNNAIQNLHWENFDRVIDEFEHLGSEIDFVYGLLSDDDKVVDEFGNWTDEGVTALALMAQEMERAKQSAEYYQNEIDTLNETWQDSGYSQTEYEEKLRELEEKQWDSIEAYEAAKDAIIDLNKVRVEAAKEAIDKEIEALEEKNEKIKESLDLEKEQYEWQKSVAEKEKSIVDIQRRLNALAGDNSASAIAERRKLQAELAQAQQEMDDMWYEHGIEEQQKSLDESLENYKENKEDEKEALDESLKDEDKIVQDAFDLINTKIGTISSTLENFENTHGVKLSSTIVDPWKNGANAMDEYSKKLAEITKEPTPAPIPEPESTPEPEQTTPTPTPTDTPKQEETPKQDAKPKSPSVGETVTVKKDAKNWSRDGGNGTKMSSWVPGSSFTVSRKDGDEVLLSRNGTYIGWIKQNQLEGYYKGTTGVKDDQWAFTDELGPELTLHAGPNGRLQYLTKGSGVVAADLTKRLMEWGELDPSQVLKNSAPKLGAPHITTNNMEINLHINEVVHIDHADSNSIQDITSAVQKQMDQYMKNVNQSLKRFTR